MQTCSSFQFKFELTSIMMLGPVIKQRVKSLKGVTLYMFDTTLRS